MKHPLTDNSKKGFTLVELLIAISIIGILAAIGLSAYQAVYRTSRDAKRKSDLKLVQSALEGYHADQKYYPTSLSFSNALKSPDGSKTYFNKLPSDPTSPNYSYQSSPANCDNSGRLCTSYCLFAKLEDTTGVTSDSACPPALPYTYGLTRP